MMMTMVGEPIPILRPNPAAQTHIQIQIPHWDPLLDDTTTHNNPPSPYGTSSGSSRGFLDSLAALHRFLPSNDRAEEEEEPIEEGDEEGSLVLDAFACDHFRMYEFKVRRCARGRSHDWTECPYAHPGEKARRRDPRRFHYSGAACPDFRKGVGCKKGDACEFAHGVFECWLHPARYRTQPCKDGSGCRRRVCFFAHSPDQLRILPHGGGFGSGSGDYSPYLSSPTSILVSPPVSPPSDSPPMSPSSPQVVSEILASMRGLQLARARMGFSPRGMQAGSMFGSPLSGSPVRTGFSSLPCTPVRAHPSSLRGPWDLGSRNEEEPAMERVESGRDIRAKMYAKLCEENSLGREPVEPDVGWISELVK